MKPEIQSQSGFNVELPQGHMCLSVACPCEWGKSLTWLHVQESLAEVILWFVLFVLLDSTNKNMDEKNDTKKVKNTS